MQLNINLATQPFEDAREFLRRWMTVGICLVLVTLGLAWYTFHNYMQARDLNRQIGEVRQQLQRLDSEEQQARAVLARPENRGTLERSTFLNSVFARKAFSWTSVFSDLEEIMPPGLHVVSIAPSLTESNELNVALVFAGNSRDHAGELVRRMEKMSRFQDVRLISETVPNLETQMQSGGMTEVQYTISARYQPSTSSTPAKTGTDRAVPAQQASRLKGAR